ncbi:hypothetical protein M493_15795 [Geobacillus genomosp. 3]|uniref:Uncharacterized protein n=1 Tax=Geobacillus genomosp. 3 TaxID=1921421 RepID=S5ZGC4_GEOG3|nr:hypothetical protein M493_15795 [Geobacillus genomosp. 3]
MGNRARRTFAANGRNEESSKGVKTAGRLKGA